MHLVMSAPKNGKGFHLWLTGNKTVQEIADDCEAAGEEFFGFWSSDSSDGNGKGMIFWCPRVNEKHWHGLGTERINAPEKALDGLNKVVCVN